MSRKVPRMCGGVQQSARARWNMAEKMGVGDISGPPLGTGLHVPTKQTKDVFMSSKWSSGSKHSGLVHPIIICSLGSQQGI